MGKLVIIPGLTSRRQPDGRVVLTQKFVEGMSLYAEGWGDRVLAVLQEGESTTAHLDAVTVHPKELPFDVEVVPFTVEAALGAVSGAEIVLGGGHHRLRGFTQRCRDMGVPCVHNTELSVRTRLQIVACSDEGRARQLRRAAWLLKEEFLHSRQELKSAAGLQANGTPTYDAYKELTPSPMLYFDNRVESREMASDADVARSNERRRKRGRLRLAFSGRLHAIKGVRDLVAIAAALRQRGVDFELELYGSGPEQEALEGDIARLGLGERVRLSGVLDFHSELLPHMRDKVDLFLCCHLQGDPSCTYVETAAAGVPIAGYANEAFAGLLRQADVGWSTPMRSIEGMADLVARLDRDRQELAKMAESSLRFAREHSFGETFSRRLNHLRSVARGFRRASHA